MKIQLTVFTSLCIATLEQNLLLSFESKILMNSDCCATWAERHGQTGAYFLSFHAKTAISGWSSML